MKLYNTLTRKIEDFQPKDSKTVTFYSCGPTVYDYPHIGNWYTFVRYDVLHRVLQAHFDDVDWVMNITDVGHLVSDADEGEDKLEKGAKREGTTAWDVAKKYTQNFIMGMEQLNFSTPTKLPLATDHINEQIKLIEALEENGHTYTIDDGVYYDTTTFPKYGDMAGLDLDHQQAGTRVELNKQKRNPSDFALWKLSPKNENRDMEWDSPWGKGFPGWHIECSAMSMKYLGETLDIHGGGIDHIPVHHTNEIAQSEGATGKKFSRFWIHTNFCLVDGKKIAKSVGSFITLEDIEGKKIDLMAFRLLVLQAHYRTEAHFTWDNLYSAQNALINLQAWADLRFQDQKSDQLATQYKHMAGAFSEKLSDDLNTPGALAVLNEMINLADTLGADSDAIRSVSKVVDDLLGLELHESPDINEHQKQLLMQRQLARESRDFSKSDLIRKQLEEERIAVKDTGAGQVWSRLL